VFDAIYARGAVAALCSDGAWLEAMCDVEAALARALASLGEIPDASAVSITAACATIARGDVAVVEQSLAANATPVIGLVAVLRDAVDEAARAHVHLGATSQDIVDTALMLLVSRAMVALLVDLDGTADAAVRLVESHRTTPMVARTLLQQALPTTFGLHVAGWLDGLDQARVHLVHVRDAEVAVQMGGPVGARAPALAAQVAAELGLVEPAIGWATIRVRPALTAAVLGTLAGVLGKIARDVTLLAQSEVGEVREGRSGASSAMIHKHNPVAAVATLACTKRTPALVATILAAMEQEHARAAGAWQAEWGTLSELLALVGSATAWVRDLLENLTVDADRMAVNLAGAPTGDQPLPAGAGELIERALAAHERGRRA
jgi:3-carboxy-cis,cis-muconate cycloisomerase